MFSTDKSQKRQARKSRIKKNVHGTKERPRLAVFRSLLNIYVQVIDDEAGHTLVSASTIDKELKAEVKELSMMETAVKIGQAVAARCLEKGISQVVFDRGGYKYHGRVKKLAESAREAGLKF